MGELSAAISAHRGNWLESSLAQLAGSLQAAVERLPNLKVAVTKAAGAKGALVGVLVNAAGRKLTLKLVGNDRIGIVKKVTAVLAKHAVNVEKLTTRTESGPMSSGMLFRAEAELTAPSALDTLTLKADARHRILATLHWHGFDRHPSILNGR